MQAVTYVDCCSRYDIVCVGPPEKFIEEEEKDKLDKMSEDEVQHLGYNGNLLILPSFITSCNIAQQS